ncbi:MAG: hypothetical protein AMK69_11125 [Nitrospira bacterium SG8_3]|jgi:hypothetical protein|nr:MAG: hypothetical protein AMK69_11125 [Nitrospira bacterium SG8_3]
MTKRILLSIITVFIAWSVLDFLIHGVVLQPTYEATAALWRPMAEMKMGLMRLVTFVFATAFVVIYGFLVSPKSLVTGIKYGVLFGLASGFSMGFGSYSYMPIPLNLAWSWFIGSLVETVAAGAIVGGIIRHPND